MSAAVLTPTPSSLESARHHHAQGQLLQAAQAYRQTLQSDPQSQSAFLGLSLIARQSNQLQPALHMAQAALAAKSESPTSSALAWSNLGDILTALRHLPQAESIFRHALSLDPNLAAAHYGLGNTFALRDDFAAALLSFQAAADLAIQLAAQLAPIPDFHFAMAFALSKLGRHPEAIAAYRRAVTARPGFASAWLNLGVELIADGRPNLAHLCYREALTASAQNPNTQISAHLNLGHLARGSRNFPQAGEHYRAALAWAATPNQANPPQPANRLANRLADRLAEIQVAFTYLHLEQNQFPEAHQSLQAAEAADTHPPNPEIPNVRGILLLAEDSTSPPMAAPQVSRIESAIAAFEQAEAGGHKTAASNRGNALLRLGRCPEALAAHQSSLDPNRGGDPHHPGVRYNLALTQLRLGDYENGWPNYEIRWSFREVHPSPRRFHQPRWRGELLAAPATLLLYSEQGLGDTIQFVRYLPLVAQRLTSSRENQGAPHLASEMWDSAVAPIRLILEVQPPLTRLLAAQFASFKVPVQVISHGDPLPAFTHHCPLMSLPALFQTTLATVPSQIPYLHAGQQPPGCPTLATPLSLSPGWDQQHPPAIGVAWAGNPSYRADHERSTHLKTFLPLLKIPGIHWVSLQKGEAAGQILELPPEISLHDGSSRDRDLADTAALVTHLDLVITTDTAVAHLAGALGKPLWLLLPWQSDWRWMQRIPTTPWYPTARLFRQSSPGNWRGLLRRVAAQLRREFPQPACVSPHSHKR
jgi:tetratricopeptide (TPR) repeat protein